MRKEGIRLIIGLRDYQREAVNAVRAAYLNGVKRQLVVLPTGTGKTIVFAYLIACMGEKALVLAHRDELIEQAASKIRLVWPEADIGIVKAERNEVGHDVTVASVQTLARGSRLDKLVADGRRFGLVVVDEAHHAVAPQWLTVLAEVGAGKAGLLLGFTATPHRTDGGALGRVFDRIVYQRTIYEMIAAGYLVRPKGM
ncbi:MAG: DEAD/DEAH box helicase, partial [Anaerolineae bacterium]